MARFAYMPFYPEDWLNGTRGMKPEEKSFYWDLLCLLWMRGGRMPNDAETIEPMMDYGIRKTKRLLERMISLGKITVHGDAIGNKRLDDELSAAAERSKKASKAATAKARRNSEDERVSSKFAQSLDQTSSKLEANFVKTLESNVTKSTSYACLEGATRARSYRLSPIEVSSSSDADDATRTSEQDPKPDRTPPPKVDHAKLLERLVTAANGSIADPAVAPGLLMTGEVVGWIQSGADLETDILPAVSSVGKRAHGKRIASWNYFAKAVTDARDKRLAGLPSVALPSAETPESRAERSERILFAGLCEGLSKGKPWPKASQYGDPGPPPGTPGCRVPPDILSKFNLPIGA